MTHTRSLFLPVVPWLLLVITSPAFAQKSGPGDENSLDSTMADGCTIASEPLHFGLLFGSSGVARSTSSIRLVCAADVDFSVSMDFGLHANGINRRMRNDVTGDHLRYRLYSDPGYRTLWSTKRKERVGGTAGSTGRVDLIVYGEIPQYDATVRGGTYSDTITVVVDF